MENVFVVLLMTTIAICDVNGGAMFGSGRMACRCLSVSVLSSIFLQHTDAKCCIAYLLALYPE